MKKIRNKLMLTMMVLTLLPALLIGAYSLYTTSEALRENALSEQRHQLTQTQQAIESHISKVEQDLLFLRDSSALQLYLAAKKTSPKRSRLLLDNLRNSALIFVQHQQIYSAVRLLDMQGEEVLRIEKSNGEAKSLTTKTDLRNQKNRDFFKQASVLKSGKVYISPMELRRSKGEVITPHQPTIRYVTVVSDENNVSQGILILNLDAKLIIRKVTENTNPAWQILFTDPEGYFYHHLDAGKQWGSPRDLGNASNAFSDKNSSLTALKGSKKPESLENKNTITLSQPISLGEDRPSLGHLFSIAAKKDLYKSLQDYFTISLLIVGISLLLSLVFAMILANSLSEPLVLLKKQVERLSLGDLDTPIKINSKNEIGDLSHAIELLRKSMNILMKRTRKV